MIVALLASMTLLNSPVDTVIRRGAEVPTSATASLAAVLDGRTPTGDVVIEGVVVRSCTAMGCWMQIAPSADTKGIMVRMKDESFFIPLNAAGMSARAVGRVVVSERTAEEAAKAAELGRHVRKSDSGEGMVEIGFEATGVELVNSDRRALTEGSGAHAH